MWDRQPPKPTGKPRLTACDAISDVSTPLQCAAEHGVPSLVLRTVDHTGTPLPGVAIEVENDGHLIGAATTDSQGNAVLSVPVDTQVVTVRGGLAGFCQSTLWFVPVRAQCVTQVPLLLRLPSNCMPVKCGRNRWCELCE